MSDNINLINSLNINDRMKQTLITDYFHKKQEKVYGYNTTTHSWHCTECGVDMGPNNPRQVCGKWHCLGYGY